MNIAFTELTPLEAGEMIKRGALGVEELTKAYLKRSTALDGEINAFLRIEEEYALKSAAAVQKRIDAKEELGPLAGVPFGLKDNICTKGLETTCASRILGGFVPPYEATLMKKMNRGGAVLLGKTNMDEFAMGSTTETSYYKTTKNPWNLEHVPGGSSGGSAAAVAAREVPYAIGSDTGGSIRQPAAYCGVTGLKPTYGAVSRFGLIAYGSSLDQIGPIAPSAIDCAAILDMIGGYDEKDATSMKTQFNAVAHIEGGVKDMVLGIPKSYFGEGLNGEVREIITGAIKVLTDAAPKWKSSTFPSSIMPYRPIILSPPRKPAPIFLVSTA